MVNYSDFLKEEMIPALGCTEPTAIAYGSSLARKHLQGSLDHIVVLCSGNLIKNARAVVVPNSGGLKGIEAAAILGAIGGDPDKKLEVLTGVSDEDIEKTKDLLDQAKVDLKLAEGIPGLYIDISMTSKEGNTSRVVIQYGHTNVILVEENGKAIHENEVKEDRAKSVDFSFDKIYNFAKEGEIDQDLKDILDLEIEANQTIAEEGLSGDWGSRIGKRIYKRGGQKNKEIAHASAGSDARMSGCELPVVINSGSGNQGMTVSLPIIQHAKAIGAKREDLYRSLIFANLLAEYQKANIGRLSAYCGVASAGSASVAGIAFMDGCSKKNNSRNLVQCPSSNIWHAM